MFHNYGPLLNLRVGGQTIRTTAEHPFWVRGRGWTDAHQLIVGDHLMGDDGRWSVLERVEGEQEAATVYNVEVEEYHTYFVGGPFWGFSAWAHNAKSYGGAPKGSGRTTIVQPVPGAGPHSVFKRDPQTGRITGHTTFDEHGFPTQRTDITGKPHGGVPTPHTHIYGPPSRTPDGRLFPPNEIDIRPAFPDEIP